MNTFIYTPLTTNDIIPLITLSFNTPKHIRDLDALSLSLRFSLLSPSSLSQDSPSIEDASSTAAAPTLLLGSVFFNQRRRTRRGLSPMSSLPLLFSFLLFLLRRGSMKW
jgi:hypothetical protein